MTQFNCNGIILDLSAPVVMGILNITPDSFYDGGRYLSAEEQVRQAALMIESGAKIIDIGAVSTRPGAGSIQAREEILRLVPALNAIRRQFPGIIISVDTFHAETARAAVENGAGMINDIYAGRHQGMLEAIGSLGVPYVMMHMKGEPVNMQEDPSYSDVLAEVSYFFEKRIAAAREAGIHQLIIDPGFGFGKTTEHNYRLLAGLETFLSFGLPVMAGISRKSMIYKTLGTLPGDALAGTIALNTIALLKGASILRVHDVREAADTVRMVQEVNKY